MIDLTNNSFYHFIFQTDTKATNGDVNTNEENNKEQTTTTN